MDSFKTFSWLSKATFVFWGNIRRISDALRKFAFSVTVSTQSHRRRSFFPGCRLVDAWPLRIVEFQRFHSNVSLWWVSFCDLQKRHKHISCALQKYMWASFFIYLRLRFRNLCTMKMLAAPSLYKISDVVPLKVINCAL